MVELEGRHTTHSAILLLSFPPPHLKRAHFYTHYTQSKAHGIPQEELVPLFEVVSCFPTSLEHLSLKCCQWKEGPPKCAISSLFCDAGHHLEASAPTYLCRRQQFTPRTTSGPTLLGCRPQTASNASTGRLSIPQNGLALAAAVLNTNVEETLKVLICAGNTLVSPMPLSSVCNTCPTKTMEPRCQLEGLLTECLPLPMQGGHQNGHNGFADISRG